MLRSIINLPFGLKAWAAVWATLIGVATASPVHAAPSVRTQEFSQTFYPSGQQVLVTECLPRMTYVPGSFSRHVLAGKAAWADQFTYPHAQVITVIPLTPDVAVSVGWSCALP